MCDHNSDSSQYFYIDTALTTELYMCECGALIDWQHPDNEKTTQHIMTPAELEQLIRAERHEAKMLLVDRFQSILWDEEGL